MSRSGEAEELSGARAPHEFREGQVHGSGIGAASGEAGGLFEELLVQHKICAFHVYEVTPVRMIFRVIALVLLAVSASAQGQEESLARLMSDSEAERSEALIALGRVPDPDVDLLIAVADRLLDPAESVRITAAYSMAGIAGKMGCKLDGLAECKLFARVLDRTPRMVKRASPKYPSAAKQAGAQGRVVVEFVVAADGTASRIRVVDGSPFLREAAAESVRQSKDEPARKGGEPVPFALLQAINFKMR